MPISAALTRLMNDARIELPGAVDNAIRQELFQTLSDFFQRTNIWWEDLAFNVTVPAGSYYDDPADYTYVVTPTAGSVNRLLFVRDSQGSLIAATMATPGTIVLSNPPNEAQTYTARVALTVTDPVTDGFPVMPDWVIGKYHLGLLSGLLSGMMAQVAKPYSSAQLATYHARKFRSEISLAKVEAQHQNVYRGQNWNYPQGFASNRQRRG